MKKLVLGLTLLGLVGMASAEEAISESHKNAALELLEVMEMGEQFSDALEAGIDTQLQANPGLMRYRQTFLDFYDQYVKWEEVKGRFAQIYAENFTEAEIKKITEFYRTDVGQKVALKTTKMMEDGMKLGEQLVMENQSELIRMMQEADAK
ncbi:DUF2059 domain-containing protein [Kangiella shandongensis]|uniref:DUF2059 domain-containing protein n=1 Tax=Kangiella shandongensis TaxID=2763258 RepID=UPI001CBEBDF3|nr:DUF2059 domain-containing protein [Kangiella shandongensis]